MQRQDRTSLLVLTYIYSYLKVGERAEKGRRRGGNFCQSGPGKAFSHASTATRHTLD